MDLKIAIIGAGIGGLTTACALRQFGFSVSVFEQAKSLGEVGAGLQLGPNAVKVISALGLETPFKKFASEIHGTVSVDGYDASLRFRTPLHEDSVKQFGAPYYAAHRADLHQMLVEALPPECIHLNKNAVDVRELEHGATVSFEDGETLNADIVIGADGVKSIVREKIFGKDNPQYTGMMCWRGMIPIEKLRRAVGPNNEVSIDHNELVGWIGKEGHVICYPIRGGAALQYFCGPCF